MLLKNKNIILTGASSGIGRALAKKIVQEKCCLALLSRNIEKLEQYAAELSESGSNVIAFKCDVTNIDEVKEAYNNVKKKFGKIDIAIFNSGIGDLVTAENFNTGLAKKIIDVNVIGMMNCTGTVLPDFIAEMGGMIVGVSSLADGRGFPKSGVYCASKAAASIFLESIRAETKKFNIKVLTVKPGFVKTPLTDKNKFDMPFLMEPDKAADIILKGIKNEKRIIKFPLPTALGAKLLRILPDTIFEFIAERAGN